jgi:hypothetical protein
VALIVLAGRAIAYAVSPSPLAATLAHRAGGPALPIVAAVSLGLAVAVSAAVVWLAAIGVRERRLVEGRALVAEPRLRLGLLAARAVCLTGSSAVSFALLESYVHWRAGLGWHGLHCLVGPVHSSALPIRAALSLVVAALAAALEHVAAWTRRTLARIAPTLPLTAQLMRPRLRPQLAPGSAIAGAAFARGPPVLS